MVSPPSALAPILGVVRNLVPPQGIIHVGAGNGTAAADLWAGIEAQRVLLLDGDPGQAAALGSAASRISGGEAACTVLGAVEEDVAPFFLTSHPAANGRLDPDAVRGLWPNLRLVDTLETPVRRLDGWLHERFGATGFPSDWLVVDCLPALPVLVGAGEALDRVELIWAAVLLDADSPIGAGASLHEVADFLTDRGFRRLATVERLHPAFGDALFVRDWRLACALRVEVLSNECAGLRVELADAGMQMREQAAIHQTEMGRLSDAQDAAVAQLENNAKQIAELEQCCEAQTRLATDRQRELEDQARTLADLVQTRDALTRAAAECRREVEELARALAAVTAERDTQAKAAADRQRKLGEQAKSLAAATERHETQAAQFDALTKTIGDLTRRGLEQDDLIKSLGAELKQAVEVGEQMQARLQECDSRQQRVDEEMLRAEAQLDLIKDLLLHP